MTSLHSLCLLPMHSVCCKCLASARAHASCSRVRHRTVDELMNDMLYSEWRCAECVADDVAECRNDVVVTSAACRKNIQQNIKFVKQKRLQVSHLKSKFTSDVVQLLLK